MGRQSDLQTKRQSFKTRKMPKTSMSHVIYAQNEAKQNPSEKEVNHSNNAIKSLTITEQVQESNQKVDWTDRRPKTHKGGSMHKATRFPRAKM